MLNNAKIKGTIMGEPSDFFEEDGVKYSQLLVETKRKSGNPDVIPVVVPTQTISTETTYTGLRIDITEGSIKSRREKTEDRNKLQIFVLAINYTLYYKEDENEEDVNTLNFEAYFQSRIVRETSLKSTKIADVYLTTEDSYFPCLLWGNAISYSDSLRKHNKVKITGRLQSRKYIKMIDEQPVEMVAYEISIYVI